MGEWLLSRRDKLIGARYEVPLQFGHLKKVTSENFTSSVIRTIRGPKWPKERSPGFTLGWLSPPE
jgi:hypothetical protein